jgi:hypothetical protein
MSLLKIARDVAQPFLSKIIHNFDRENKSAQMWATIEIKKKTAQGKR